MERILFKEEQRFTQWWLWLIVTASFAVPLIFIVSEIAVLERDSEEYQSLLTSIYFLLGMGLLMVGLFIKMKLVTQITSDGIRVKFPPMKMRWKIITRLIGGLFLLFGLLGILEVPLASTSFFRSCLSWIQPFYRNISPELIGIGDPASH